MVNTTVRITVTDICDADACSLDWELNNEDNNNPVCYRVGTEYYLRLKRIPPQMTASVFSTNASVVYDSEQTEEIEEEYVIFTGDQENNSSKTIDSDFSYEIIGNVYSETGVLLPSVTFTIHPGTAQITASIPCYAVLKIDYTHKYDRYKFVAFSEGMVLFVARGLCPYTNEYVTGTLNQEIKLSCVEEECLPIEIEIDTSSEEGANYDNDSKKLIKVYGANRNQIEVLNSRGSITYLGIANDEIEEEFEVCDRQINAQKRVHVIKSQQITSGNLKNVFVENGELVFPENPDAEDINGIPYGYGTIKVVYLTQYLKFLITSEISGHSVFLVRDIVNEDCEWHCIGFEIGTEPGEKLYDITVIYRDFVTGNPIAEAEVWVDDKYIGQTDDSGEILVKGMTGNKKHLIKASKPGYLNTNSDSLANDSFIINVND